MSTVSRSARPLGLAAGFLLDRVLADPARMHPVAGFGTIAGHVESFLLPRPSVPAARLRGVVFTLTLVGGSGLLAGGIDRALTGHPAARVAFGAATYWSCLGGTSLLRVAGRLAELLETGDTDGARDLLPWLCGRDPWRLDEAGIARAVVESVAENTSDAAVATLVWGALLGPAGAVAHRAVNTLDAMVGHRSPRHERFGWASARLDDVMGWPAARTAGLLTAALAPTVGGRPGAALRAWRRDAPAHPSPNAGVVEASCAGALGVGLGGPTPYHYGIQDRPRLGTGRAPEPADIRRAVVLQRRVQNGAVVLAVLLATQLSPSRLTRFWAYRRSASKR